MKLQALCNACKRVFEREFEGAPSFDIECPHCRECDYSILRFYKEAKKEDGEMP